MRLKHSMSQTQVQALLRFECEQESPGEPVILQILIQRVWAGAESLRFCPAPR